MDVKSVLMGQLGYLKRLAVLLSDPVEPFHSSVGWVRKKMAVVLSGSALRSRIRFFQTRALSDGSRPAFWMDGLSRSDAKGMHRNNATASSAPIQRNEVTLTLSKISHGIVSLRDTFSQVP